MAENWKIGPWSKFIVKDYDYTSSVNKLGLSWMSNLNKDVPSQAQIGIKETRRTFNDWGEDKVKKYKGYPEWWRYHTDQLTYDFNSHGFRAPDFDTVDWQNSWIILGCSHVMGVGNPIDETLGYYLQQHLNEPVINLGVAGASNDVIFNNFVYAMTNHKPKGVIVFWTYPSRFTHITDYNQGGEDEHENYWDPYWLHYDVQPGTDGPDSKELKDFMLSPWDFTSHPRHFYRKTLARTVVESMAPAGNLMQYQADLPTWGWRPRLDYHPLHDLQNEPIPDYAKDIVQRLYNEPDGTRWDQFSLDAQKWVMNELKARDIHRYNPKTGPRGAHFGRYVNQYLARKFIESRR